VLDLEAIAAVAREHGALTCIDNSWATPLLQKPIPLGVDMVVHSATKYIGGHSDVVAGAVVSAERMHAIFERAFMLNGGILAPFDAWLLLRGLRTLPARLRQQGADGLASPTTCAGTSASRRVLAPRPRPRTTSPAHAGVFRGSSARPRAADATALDVVRRFIDALDRFRDRRQLGRRREPGRRAQPRHQRADLDAHGIPHSGLVRLSVGLEGADALVDDLGPRSDRP
jgi:cystathionine beta-lyase/cystathionine gamma-synthase